MKSKQEFQQRQSSGLGMREELTAYLEERVQMRACHPCGMKTNIFLGALPFGLLPHLIYFLSSVGSTSNVFLGSVHFY